MNGKITITVPMEKVPMEISRLLSDLTSRLESLAAISKSLQEDVITKQLDTINQIDNIRKSLSLIDFNYEDCYTILVGYLKYQAEIRVREAQKQNDKQSNG